MPSPVPAFLLAGLSNYRLAARGDPIGEGSAALNPRNPADNRAISPIHLRPLPLVYFSSDIFLPLIFIGYFLNKLCFTA
jgi:hypothetical protein